MMKRKYLKTLLVGIALVATASILNCSPAEFTQVPKPTGGLEPTHCEGYIPDQYGCLKSRCEGGVANPRVILTWCTNPNANSNSLQKVLVPNTVWDWIDPITTPEGTTGSNFSMDQRSYTDLSVNGNNTYSYRVKFRPELPSNQLTIPLNSCTCGS